MVSKQLHCLNDLLFRHSTGDLQIEVPAVVSNHLDAEPLVKSYGLDFHHIPVTPDTKAEAEARAAWQLVEQHDIHLVVLARYMQILSDGLCRHAERPGHQHPPLVPAVLQGRQALPRGVRARA